MRWHRQLWLRLGRWCRSRQRPLEVSRSLACRRLLLWKLLLLLLLQLLLLLWLLLLLLLLQMDELGRIWRRHLCGEELWRKPTSGLLL